MARSACIRGAHGTTTQRVRTRATNHRCSAAARSSTTAAEDDVEVVDDESPLVLVESQTEDGNAARVVLKTGAEIDVEQAANLCVRVGWARRQPHKLKLALENSFMVASLHVEELDVPPSDLSSNDNAPLKSRRLIGISRATSDHVFNATIWDVLVDPKYQGMGLGKALVEQSVRTLLRRGISNISLFADNHVVDFYRKLGFTAEQQRVGMFFYPR